MKNALLLLLLMTISLLTHAGNKKENTQQFNGSNIIYIDVNIDQPNVDECYDETKVPDTGIEKWLNVYPNPGQGVFNLEIQQLQFGESIKVSVLKTTGENVYQTTVNANGEHYQMKLNLGHLTKGVYLLLVNTNRGFNVQRLIIL